MWGFLSGISHTPCHRLAQESGPHTHLLQKVGLLRSTGKRLNVGVQLAHLLQGPVSTLTVEGRHWNPLTAGGGKAEGGVHLGRGRVWSQQHTRERKAPPFSLPHHRSFFGHTSLPNPAHRLGPVANEKWENLHQHPFNTISPPHTHTHTQTHTHTLVLPLPELATWPPSRGRASRRQQDWWTRWQQGHQPHLLSCMAPSVH